MIAVRLPIPPMKVGIRNPNSARHRTVWMTFGSSPDPSHVDLRASPTTRRPRARSPQRQGSRYHHQAEMFEREVDDFVNH